MESWAYTFGLNSPAYLKWASWEWSACMVSDTLSRLSLKGELTHAGYRALKVLILYTWSIITIQHVHDQFLFLTFIFPARPQTVAHQQLLNIVVCVLYINDGTDMVVKWVRFMFFQTVSFENFEGPTILSGTGMKYHQLYGASGQSSQIIILEWSPALGHVHPNSPDCHMY